jgi:hypothetical protein
MDGLDQRCRSRCRIGLLRLHRTGVRRGERGDGGEEARCGEAGGEDAAGSSGVTPTIAEQANAGVAIDRRGRDNGLGDNGLGDNGLGN